MIRNIKRKSKKENMKGITLIALVIAIIVLLILAAISINMLTGQNGIITKAQSAQEDTDAAKAKEKVQLLLSDFNAERYLGTVDLMTYMNDKKDRGEISKATDNTGETITIEVDEYAVNVKTEDLSILSVTKVKKKTSNGPTKAPGPVPENVSDYYMFLDDTATSGGWKVTLSYEFKSAVDSNVIFKNWQPGTALPNPGSIYQGKYVTTMEEMFCNSNATSLDLSDFDTSKVTNMSDMFFDSKATTIDLNSFEIQGYGTPAYQ